MQRLYLQFYATILLVLAVFVGAALLTWRLAEEQTPQYMDVAAELTGALLPEADAPQEEDQKALDALHRKLRFDLALYRPDGSLLAVAGRPPPRFDPNRARVGWWRGRSANGRARPCGSRASSCCWPRRSRSAPIRWCAGWAAGWSDSRPAS